MEKLHTLDTLLKSLLIYFLVSSFDRFMSVIHNLYMYVYIYIYIRQMNNADILRYSSNMKNYILNLSHHWRFMGKR